MSWVSLRVDGRKAYGQQQSHSPSYLREREEEWKWQREWEKEKGFQSKISASNYLELPIAGSRERRTSLA